MLHGGCFCGFVRYEAEGRASDETLCHCVDCRRVSAAPSVAWFTVPLARFRIATGEPTRFRSSEHATRTFCPRCGTPLSFQTDHHPNEIDVTTCSLDDPGLCPPKSHT